MQLKRSSYHLLLLTGLVLILIFFFINQIKTVDIHVHDTYYVIALGHIWWLLAFIIWFLWFLYLLTRKVLYSELLTWIHVVITILTVLFLLSLSCTSGTTFLTRSQGATWTIVVGTHLTITTETCG